ncbi:hypothetical protein [Salisaeta longa]|uniref:hypothetical protein n=1 Tax=Salisaeta longa TaxID=503170 RepID=UPI0003B346FB|nr:hypothetical protein [Salisaeta longa]
MNSRSRVRLFTAVYVVVGGLATVIALYRVQHGAYAGAALMAAIALFSAYRVYTLDPEDA